MLTTPAETRVFNILSELESDYFPEVSLSNLQATHADTYGTYKGVVEALNSLCQKGLVASRVMSPDPYFFGDNGVPTSAERHYWVVPPVIQGPVKPVHQQHDHYGCDIG